jgi:ABC-type branched-subunit amino acid transport system substrate-binding protein
MTILGVFTDSRRRRRIARWGVIAIGCTALLTATACSSSGNTSSGNAQASGSNTIPIGLLASESGAYGILGEPSIAGAQVAVDDINASGGITIHGTKYTLKMYVLNDRSDPQTALSDALQLANTDHVVAIFGPVANAGVTVAPVTNQRNVINVTPSSGAQALMGSSKYPYLFGTSPDPTYKAETVINGILHWYPNAKRIAVVSPNNAAAQDLIPLIAKDAKAAGLTYQQYLFPASSTDISAEATNIVNFHPDVVWAQPDDQTVLSIISQLTSAGLPKNIPVFNWGGDVTVASGANGRPVITQSETEAYLTPGSTNAAINSYLTQVDAQLKAAGRPASDAVESGLYYPVIKAFAMALAKAQTASNTAAIAQAMTAIQAVPVWGEQVQWVADHSFPYPIVSVLSTPSGTKTAVITSS